MTTDLFVSVSKETVLFNRAQLSWGSGLRLRGCRWAGAEAWRGGQVDVFAFSRGGGGPRVRRLLLLLSDGRHGHRASTGLDGAQARRGRRRGRLRWRLRRTRSHRRLKLRYRWQRYVHSFNICIQVESSRTINGLSIERDCWLQVFELNLKRKHKF